MTFANRPAASATLPGNKTLRISDGRATLDARWAPYCQADITVPLESVAIAESLDPSANQRVTVLGRLDDLGGTYPPELARSFNLVMRDREIDHKAKTIRLQLASDEALAQEYAKLTDDKTPRVHEANLRNLVNYVLGQSVPGAALQAGSATADLTARWTAENLVPDPRGTSAALWGSGGDGAATRVSTSSSSTVLNSFGVTTRIQCRVTTDVSSYFDIAQSVSGVAPGQIYNFSVYGYHTAGANRIVRMDVVWKNRDGQDIRVDQGSSHTFASSTWARVSTVAVAPAGAVGARFRIRFLGAFAVGNEMTVSAALVTSGPELLQYFDGAVTNTSIYTYTWQGDANASTSLRTPDIERHPDLFTWSSGVNAWEFLRPLLGAAGLRLWCDEQRRWWLMNPETHSLDGRIAVTPARTVEGTDTISKQDPSVNATGVIVRYEWLENGIQRTRDDVAGVNGKIHLVTMHRPFPGVGLATAILTRIKGRRRIQRVTVAADYAATPAMEVSISLPGAYDQYGRIDAVVWDLATGLMEIESAALTEAAPGTWLHGYDDLAWSAVPDARTWATA